ncbi:MAG: hypothetical protein QOK21_2745 [Solirubrobacteraceae bacterium]|jgi:hypothetical protein|nr:hypothetical protein [Solirubrobacteraceae bacterium]
MRAPDPFDDPVLTELAGSVAAVRPAPSAAAARRIDARVAHRLGPRPSLRKRWSGMEMPALALAACAVLVVVIGIAAAGGSHTSGSSSSSGGSMTAPEQTSGGSSASSAGSSASIAPSGGVTPPRAIERDTTMTIATAPSRVDQVASAAAAVAADLGGYVSSSDVTTGQVASLELRVPGERLDPAVSRLSRLGHVRDLQRSTLDITGELGNARQQVADLRAERRSLLRRLAHAGTPRIADHARARLAVVTRRLNDARGRVRAVHARSDLASLSLTIKGERRGGAGPAPHPWTPGDALHDAGRVLEVAAGVALVALAVAVPFALLGGLAWLAARTLGRRRRERLLDGA